MCKAYRALCDGVRKLSNFLWGIDVACSATNGDCRVGLCPPLNDKQNATVGITVKCTRPCFREKAGAGFGFVWV